MRLLIYQPSWRRIAEDLPPGIEPVWLTEEGRLAVGGGEVSIEAADPDAAWMNADVWLSPFLQAFGDAMLQAPNLKWVQSGSAGVDSPVLGQVLAKGVRITTSHGQAVGISEYVLAGVLDHFQGGPARRAAQAARDWRRRRFREIMGSRWLVIGYGAIGQAVAARAKAFGAHVTGVRRSQVAHLAADAIAPPEDLPTLLPDADVVVLSIPLTPQTGGMVDVRFLAAMKPGSVLVNVGRGGLVDEPALLEALDRGVPEQAVLDVFETEPLPRESRFWSHPRVSLTSHLAGDTDGLWTRNDAIFLDNIQRYLSGEPLLHEVRPPSSRETT